MTKLEAVLALCLSVVSVLFVTTLSGLMTSTLVSTLSNAFGQAASSISTFVTAAGESPLLVRLVDMAAEQAFVLASLATLSVIIKRQVRAVATEFDQKLDAKTASLRALVQPALNTLQSNTNTIANNAALATESVDDLARAAQTVGNAAQQFADTTDKVTTTVGDVVTGMGIGYLAGTLIVIAARAYQKMYGPKVEQERRSSRAVVIDTLLLMHSWMVGLAGLVSISPRLISDAGAMLRAAREINNQEESESEELRASAMMQMGQFLGVGFEHPEETWTQWAARKRPTLVFYGLVVVGGIIMLWKTQSKKVEEDEEKLEKLERQFAQLSATVAERRLPEIEHNERPAPTKKNVKQEKKARMGKGASGAAIDDKVQEFRIPERLNVTVEKTAVTPERLVDLAAVDVAKLSSVPMMFDGRCEGYAGRVTVAGKDCLVTIGHIAEAGMYLPDGTKAVHLNFDSARAETDKTYAADPSPKWLHEGNSEGDYIHVLKPGPVMPKSLGEAVPASKGMRCVIVAGGKVSHGVVTDQLPNAGFIHSCHSEFGHSGAIILGFANNRWSPIGVHVGRCTNVKGNAAVAFLE